MLWQVEDLEETVAKTAQTLNRSESQSKVRTSRVALFVGIDLSLPILSEIPLLRAERC